MSRQHPMRLARAPFCCRPVPWLAVLLSITVVPAGWAQTPVAEAAWFDVPLPPGFEPHVAPAVIGDRGPSPAIVPPGEGEYLDLAGAAIRADLETIVQFSKESRERREIGSGQLWGRITGFRSSRETIAWAAEQFRAAGIEDVELQPFDQALDAAFWLPLSWELRLVGDPAFGRRSEDVVLSTAMPLSPSELPVEGLTAPLVHVGTASAAELMHIDVRGAVAVQHVTPQAHMVFERTPTVPRARALFERGAVGVINVVDQPGNERARDFSNCGGPCFNLGGRDGVFLETVMDRAAEAGVSGQLRMWLSLDTDRRSGLSAHNGVAIIPGTGPTTRSSSTPTPTPGSTAPATTAMASRCSSRWRDTSPAGPISRGAPSCSWRAPVITRPG